MQLKYDNIFTVTYDIDNLTLDAKIPKLSLQPILENAFMHGFDLNSDNNEITISVHQRKNDIEIIISDNGIGMSDEELTNIKNSIKIKTHTSKIGITNINNRLNSIFGKNYGLSIHSELYNGTSIHLNLPKNY